MLSLWGTKYVIIVGKKYVIIMGNKICYHYEE